MTEKSQSYKVVEYRVRGGESVKRILGGWSTIFQKETPVMVGRKGLEKSEAEDLKLYRIKQLERIGNDKGMIVEVRNTISTDLSLGEVMEIYF